MAPASAAAPDRIAVLGAGSWGTALAVQLARTGQRVTLWGRDRGALLELARQRCNRRYLPDVPLPAGLGVNPDLPGLVQEHRDLLVCVPSHAFRSILDVMRATLRPDARLAWATKGFEHDTGQLPHAVAREVLGATLPVAVLSGPTFAREVGAGLPTALTVAASDPAFASDLAARLSDATFRAYTSTDMIGVEVGGAVKNVLAIGAGISDGLGFGANTRIALITRGLSEMTRLGVTLGARASTFMGLSGMGDLVLSCTDDQSRNRRFGLLVARGVAVPDAALRIGQVVEGRFAAGAVRSVAAQHGLEMPICEQVYQVLEGGLAPEKAVRALMARSLKAESDGQFWDAAR
ncbi:MAG: NAD(P)-dependent glycerol-3-phosphate dehydrogenase [Gammaproteobacteria bacterium]|nr:NAD(P)-dependent glycerol-3-phosphate dehydrogenase [Gammaproteobacteria bacterium]